MSSPRDLLNKFGTMKTLPHVALRLTKLVADETSTMQDFENLIKIDPSLVLRLLRQVNSPFYGLQDKVDSISRAVVFVGMKNLRNMVVTTALSDIFQDKPGESFSKAKLWFHSAAVGICAKLVSERIFGVNGEDYYLCGILHDIGMVVEDQVAHDEWINTCNTFEPGAGGFTAHERELLGTDHCEIGALLVNDWGLSEEVQVGVERHHRINEKIQPSSLAGVVQISDYLITKMGYAAIPGVGSALANNLVLHIKENFAEFKALADSLPEELSKAEEIYMKAEEK